MKYTKKPEKTTFLALPTIHSKKHLYFNKKSYVLFTLLSSIFLVGTPLPSFILDINAATYPSNLLFEMIVFFLFMFSITSLIIAFTTLNKKKKTVFDIALNITIPLIFLCKIRIDSFYPNTANIILSLIASYAIVFKVKPLYIQSKSDEFGDLLDNCYYCFLKHFLLLSLLLLSSMIVFINEVKVKKTEISQISYNYKYLDDAEYSKLSSEEIHSYIHSAIHYEAEQLKIDVPKVNIVKNTGSNAIAFYNPQMDVIVIDSDYIDTCSQQKVIEVVAHEMFHKKQQVSLNLIKELEENGIFIEDLIYFDDLIKLKKAHEQYSNSSTDYEKYYYNQIEIDARNYALGEVNYIIANKGE